MCVYVCMYVYIYIYIYKKFLFGPKSKNKISFKKSNWSTMRFKKKIFIS